MPTFFISTTLARYAKRLAKLALLSVLLFLLVWLPIFGYGERVIKSIKEHGLSAQTLHAIKQHNQWFTHFFTGPPSDAEMLAFFKKYRKEMEYIAYLYATEVCGYGYDRDGNPCAVRRKTRFRPDVVFWFCA